MGNIFVRFLQMPTTVRGTVSEDADGNYNVYLNPALDVDTLRRTYDHELKHIRNGDLRRDGDVDGMEAALDG